jgi:flagellar M-ring protein FliF
MTAASLAPRSLPHRLWAMRGVRIAMACALVVACGVALVAAFFAARPREPGVIADAGHALDAQDRLERSLEERVVTLLEPALGQGAVVARVSATMDTAEEDVTSSTTDPAADATSDAGGGDRIVTRRVQRAPRLLRLSVAVLVDNVKGIPPPASELRRLAELARRAVGFDEERGDKLEIASAPFVERAQPSGPSPTTIALLGIVLLGVVVAGGVALRAYLRRAVQVPQAPPPVPTSEDIRSRAQRIALERPARAALVLQAWLAEDKRSALAPPFDASRVDEDRARIDEALARRGGPDAG